MKNTGTEGQSRSEKAKAVVLSLAQALNRQDFQAARKYVKDDLKFVSVFGPRDGADAYFDEMERIRANYHTLKVFADNEDVCVLYDLTVTGITMFVCGWFQVQEGQVSSMRVVFDPRPVLELQAKNK